MSFVSISIGSVIYAMVLCWLLAMIANLRKPIPAFLKWKFIPIFGSALCINASRLWSPKKVTLSRTNGNEEADVLTVDYGRLLERESQPDAGNTDEKSIESNDTVYWNKFANILSIIFFILYFLGVLAIILTHR